MNGMQKKWWSLLVGQKSIALGGFLQAMCSGDERHKQQCDKLWIERLGVIEVELNGRHVSFSHGPVGGTVK
jgi:hypothetical protein